MSSNGALPGKDGFTVLHYVGRSVGTQTFFHPDSGQAYRFGDNDKNRYGYVDQDDAAWFLGLREGGANLFIRAVPPSAELDLSDKQKDVALFELEPPPSAIDATDAAIALALEHDIDLMAIQGSGKDGRIVKADVDALVV